MVKKILFIHTWPPFSFGLRYESFNFDHNHIDNPSFGSPIIAIETCSHTKPAIESFEGSFSNSLLNSKEMQS